MPELSHTLVTVIMAAALSGGLAGALGCFLVLRGQGLLGDVLSHAALPGVVAGFLVAGSRDFGAILAGALVAGALAGLTVQVLRRGAGLRADAALGVVLSLYFAGGVVLYSHAQGLPGAAGLQVFLFGQAASVLRADLWPLAAVGAGVLVVLGALWKEFHFVTFDPEAARAQGLPVAGLEALLGVLVAVAIVLGLALAGVVLMVAMLIAPAVAARQWVHRLAPMVALAMALGVLAGVTGAVISAQAAGLATGPVMVLAASTLVALSLMLAPGRGIAARALARRRARGQIRTRQVLGALQGLGADHGDPFHRADEGMLEALLGGGTGAELERMARAGLVRALPHGPDGRRHWQLTEAGRAAALDTPEAKP